MTQLRLFPVKTGERVTPCTGCRKDILPRTAAVMRQDRALFCSEPCALEFDDAQVDAETFQVLTEAAP